MKSVHFMSNSEIDRIFKEAANGYGFEEIKQSADGVYCDGCLHVHKRPTKMYSNDGKHKYCKYAVVKFYNPEEE